MMNNDYTIDRGQVGQATIKYQDYDTSVQVSLILDTDVNPYNNNDAASFGWGTLGNTGNGLGSSTQLFNTSDLEPGTYPIYARVSDAHQTRYIYAAEPLIVTGVVPAAPTDLNATAQSSSRIDLTWTDRSNNEDGFKVERSPNGSSNWSQIGSTGPSGTHYSDTGLSPDTTSYYRVRAHNRAGNSDYSNSAFATTESDGGNQPPSIGYLHPNADISASAKDSNEIVVTTINRDTKPIAFEGAFEPGTNDEWSVSDLISQAGGPNVSEITTWVDPRDKLTYAAGISTSGVILYKRNSEGAWSYRDLKGEIWGAEVITNQIEVLVTTGAEPRVSIVGLDAHGDLLRYYQDGTGNNGNYGWDSMNLGDHLRGRGQQMPNFHDKIIAYTTPWGELAVAGLDAQGDVQTVWWAPGRPGWNANNLSDIAGTERLIGGLTIWQTSWGDKNIGGINANGHLVDTWWSITHQTWYSNDLTAEYNGPLF